MTRLIITNALNLLLQHLFSILSVLVGDELLISIFSNSKREVSPQAQNSNLKLFKNNRLPTGF